jgi:hypothetical protein
MTLKQLFGRKAYDFAQNGYNRTRFVQRCYMNSPYGQLVSASICYKCSVYVASYGTLGGLECCRKGHSRSVTLAAIAGAKRSVRWTRTKL